MADEVVNISLQADITKLTAELSRLGPEGDKEAKKLVAALQRQYKKAEAAAKASAKATNVAYTSQFNKVSSAAAAMAGAVGGSFGKMGSLANSALKPLAEVAAGFGVAGTAALGAGVAVAGVGVGALVAARATSALVGEFHALGDASAAAAERLIATGHAAEISAAALHSLEQYRAGQTQLSLSTDQLLVSEHAFAGAVGLVSYELSRAASAFAEADKSGVQWLGTLTDLNTLGFTHILRPYVDDLVQTETKSLDVIARTQDLITNLQKASAAAVKLNNSGGGFQGPQLEDGGPSAERQAAAERKAAEAARIHASYVDAVTKGNEEQAAANLKNRLALSDFNGEMYKLDLLSKAAGESSAEVGVAIDEWMARTADAPKVTASVGQIRDAALEAGSQIADSFGQIFDALAERQLEAYEDVKKAGDRLRDDQRKLSSEIMVARKLAMNATSDEAKAQADQQVASLEQEQNNVAVKLKLNQMLAEDHRKKAMRAFVAEKLAAIAAVGMQTSIAVMNAMATLPWPANAIAAAGVGVMGATQAAVIASKKPPEFPMGFVPNPGGSPDHQVAVAIQPDREAALNGRGVDGVGGPGGVRRLNEGRGGGGGTHVDVHIARRLAASGDGRGPVRVDPRSGKSGRGRR